MTLRTRAELISAADTNLFDNDTRDISPADVRNIIKDMADSGTIPVGTSVEYGGHTAPPGWLLKYGQNVSRTTYAALFAATCKQATVTAPVASPGVINWTAHGHKANDPVSFTTTGTLPTGLTAGTTYYLIATGLATDSFRLSATVGGAAINFTGSTSGVHTGLYAPHGRGDGSTTFGIEDDRGRVTAGRDDMGSTAANRLSGQSGGVDGKTLGAVGGAERHQLVVGELASHVHTESQATYTFLQGGSNSGGTVGSGNTGSAGSDLPHNNVQPTIIKNKIIFTGVY